MQKETEATQKIM